ncbi:MAG: hypothetical protein LUQ09_02950, partial [Methanomassiliicoccales archaeon]|nr:hypothetical protein [Methanomassiliicoccales archaeon]
MALSYYIAGSYSEYFYALVIFFISSSSIIWFGLVDSNKKIRKKLDIDDKIQLQLLKIFKNDMRHAINEFDVIFEVKRIIKETSCSEIEKCFKILKECDFITLPGTKKQGSNENKTGTIFSYNPLSEKHDHFYLTFTGLRKYYSILHPSKSSIGNRLFDYIKYHIFKIARKLHELKRLSKIVIAFIIASIIFFLLAFSFGKALDEIENSIFLIPLYSIIWITIGFFIARKIWNRDWVEKTMATILV